MHWEGSAMKKSLNSKFVYLVPREFFLLILIFSGITLKIVILTTDALEVPFQLCTWGERLTTSPSFQIWWLAQGHSQFQQEHFQWPRWDKAFHSWSVDGKWWEVGAFSVLHFENPRVRWEDGTLQRKGPARLAANQTGVTSTTHSTASESLLIPWGQWQRVSSHMPTSMLNHDLDFTSWEIGRETHRTITAMPPPPNQGWWCPCWDAKILLSGWRMVPLDNAGGTWSPSVVQSIHFQSAFEAQSSLSLPSGIVYGLMRSLSLCSMWAPFWNLIPYHQTCQSQVHLYVSQTLSPKMTWLQASPISP